MSTSSARPSSGRRSRKGRSGFASRGRRVVLEKRTYLSENVLRAWTWYDEVPGDRMWTHWSAELVETLGSNITHDILESAPTTDEADRIAQFDAVKRWFEDD